MNFGDRGQSARFRRRNTAREADAPYSVRGGNSAQRLSRRKSRKKKLHNRQEMVVDLGGTIQGELNERAWERIVTVRKWSPMC